MPEKQPDAGRDADVSRETSALLAVFAELVRAENGRQNLVSASTLAEMQSRHIDDSLQLTRFFPSQASSLLDIGSGAGFPGLVLVIATRLAVTLSEPRKTRAAFLRDAVTRLGLDNVVVTDRKAEAIIGQFDVITARAVAALDKLFAMSDHLSHPDTIWILPKGRSAQAELAAARQTWQGRFEIMPSVTDSTAGIVIAREVRRRQPR